jgi:hypothetical protein
MKIANGQALTALAVCVLAAVPCGVRAAGAGIVAGEVVGALLVYRAVAGTLKLIRVVMWAGMLLSSLCGLVLMAVVYTANLGFTDHAWGIAGLWLLGAPLLAWWQWEVLPFGGAERILRFVPRRLVSKRNTGS